MKFRPQQKKVQRFGKNYQRYGAVMKQHLMGIIRGTEGRLDRRGVTAVEYGIVAAFLCLSLLAVFARFGNVLSTMFNKVTTSI